MTRSTATALASLGNGWVDTIAGQAAEPGPQWLQEMRQAAAGAFRDNGLPGNKDEAWKYTSLRRLEALAPSIDFPDRGPAPAWQPLMPEPEGFGFQLVNGHFEWLEAGAPDGVTAISLAAALEPGRDSALQDRIRQMLESVEVRGRSRAFEALNTASLGNGVVIHVAAGCDAGTCVARWGSFLADTARLVNFRVVLVLDAGARLQLLEQYSSAGTRFENAAVAAESATGRQRGQALNLLLQADIAADAGLRHVVVQNISEQGVLLTFARIRQAERSRYDYAGFDLGGGLVRHDISCRLEGAQAEAVLNGAFLLAGERHVDNHIRVDHLATGCTSDQFFRGILAGRSRGVFNGKAVIHPGADGSRVVQSNANLLLSDEAEIDTKPELEIYADEVEARHGATVGQLDEQAVFYMRTRGLSEAEARRQLTGAFCRAVTGRLADTVLAGHLADLLDESMAAVAEPALGADAGDDRGGRP